MKKLAIYLFLALTLYGCTNNSSSIIFKLAEGSWNDLKDNELFGPIKSVSYYQLKDNLDILYQNMEDTFCFRKMEFDSNGALFRLSQFGFDDKELGKEKKTITSYFHEYENSYLIQSGLEKDKADRCDYKTYTYSKNGLLNRIDINYCEPYEGAVQSILYFFNSQQELIEKQSVSKNKKGMDTSYQYFTDGFLSSGLSPNKKVYKQEIISRDSQGRISEYEVLYFDNDSVRDKLRMRITEYDNYGNWLQQERVNFSHSGKNITDIIIRKMDYFQ